MSIRNYDSTQTNHRKNLSSSFARKSNWKIIETGGALGVNVETLSDGSENRKFEVSRIAGNLFLTYFRVFTHFRSPEKILIPLCTRPNLYKLQINFTPIPSHPMNLKSYFVVFLAHLSFRHCFSF